MDSDPVGDLALLAARDPRVRFAAETRLRAAGAAGRSALGRLVACEPVPAILRARAADLLGTLLRELTVEAFRVAVPDPTRADLWPAAVAIATEGHPDLDPTEVDARLEGLVDDARHVVRDGLAPAERVARLTAFLHEDAGLRGDEHGTTDLRNSYLPDVLERRLGIPVTLAVVWLEVARRLGLPGAGVGLPLHFVARCETAQGPIFIDAFHGEVLDEEGCRSLVAKSAGRPIEVPDRFLHPLRTSEVLARMLRNLRAAHERAGNLHAALATADRLLHLTPLDVPALKDRAILLARLDRPAAAARTVARALALEPNAGDRAPLEAFRKSMLREATRRN
jgi:regulator of sirC expression with transglutaminase-like and TPR domain